MTASQVLKARQRRAQRRQRAKRALGAAIGLAAGVGVALALAKGGAPLEASAEGARTWGRMFGITAAVLMMSQMLLASRAPYVERVIGHDHALALHTRLGKIAISLMVVHLALVLGSLAAVSGLGTWEVFTELRRSSGAFGVATAAIILFGVVFATSFWAGVRRWNYESWHVVHRLTYVAVAFAVPHQFLEGSTFREGGAAWVFWFALYVVAVGSFVVFRMARPLWLTVRHQARVAEVRIEEDGSTTVEIEGRGFDRLRARSGQFFLWRFWQGSLIVEKHPYSLSSVPANDRLRITVKPSGRGSSRLASLRPGVRVTFEGPLGVFTHADRTGDGLVLVAAGIGVTPIRAMLEEASSDEVVTVVLRARSREEAPLLAEVEALARTVGADLHVVFGPRGDSWSAAGEKRTLLDFAPHLATSDVFVCGPVDWALEVEAEARRCGVPAHAIHRERFGW